MAGVALIWPAYYVCSISHPDLALSPFEENYLERIRIIATPLTTPSVVAVSHNLRSEGAALIVGAFPLRDVERLSSLSAALYSRHLSSSSGKGPQAVAGSSGSKATKWSPGSPKRLHMNLHLLPKGESLPFSELAILFEPLALAFLSPAAPGASSSGANAAAAGRRGRIVQSELQLVTSLPGATEQPWHADNPRGGM